jgi:hypothetical protein
MGMRPLLIMLLLAVLSRHAEAQDVPPQSLWASLGAGGSAKGIVLMASASYSRGRAVVMGRGDMTGAIIGEAVEGKAILAGMRTGKGARFALAAVGIGRSRSMHRPSEGTRTVLAFHVQGQPRFAWTPIGIALLGAAGPGDTSYLGAALTLDFGWFKGEPPDCIRC